MKLHVLFLAGFILLAALLLHYVVQAEGSADKIGPELKEKAVVSPDSIARVIIKMKNISNDPVKKIVRSLRTNASLDSGKILKKRNLGNALVAAEIQLSELGALAADENIEYITEDKIMHAFLSQSVPIIGANTVWGRQISGENITGTGTSVCVIDTGVDYTHPDLGGCIGEGCKVAGGYDFVNSDENPVDDHGHGTHVAGIVAANGTLKGVAPDARIIAIKALNFEGSGYASDIIAGIDWCVFNSTKFNISIISMSLGGDTVYPSYCDGSDEINAAFSSSINAAVAKNISVVIATGNNGATTGISAPACIENATRVTATTKSDIYAGFANRAASFPDILAAPGASITSTYLSSGQTTLSGTSMSTPHVSGAIALLSQAYRKVYNSTQTPAYFKNLLNSTGKQISDAQTGTSFSRINVSAAYRNILSNAPFVWIAIASPRDGSFINLNFSGIIASQRGISWMNFSIDGGSNISACDDCSSFASFTGNLTEGMHNITVYANNSIVPLNYTIAYFTIDTLPPLIAFENQTEGNNTFFDRNWIFVNLSASDANFANATFFLFNSSGLVSSTSEVNVSSLYVNWTNLSEGVYFFNATASDFAGNSNRTETRTETIDLAAPTIGNIAVFPPVAYSGQDVTISYTATDISPLNSTVNIIHNNTSEALNVSNSGANYQVIFSNTSDLGIYGVAILATDALNRISTLNSSFRILTETNISFNFTTSIPLTLRIKYDGTEIRNFSANSTEEKSVSFGSENYSLEAREDNETFSITFEGVEFMQNKTLGISLLNISASSPDEVKYRFTNNSFSLSPEFNYSSATVCFNYSLYTSTFSNLSRMTNFKCEGTCSDGGWAAIPTSQDSATNQSCSNVTSFSSFVLGETLPFCGDGNIDAGETCSSCPADVGACPVQATQSGGGGWIMIKPENVTNVSNVPNISNNIVAGSIIENISSAENITETKATAKNESSRISMTEKTERCAGTTGFFAMYHTKWLVLAIVKFIIAFMFL